MTSKIRVCLHGALRFSVIGAFLAISGAGCHADNPITPQFDKGPLDVLPGKPDRPPGCNSTLLPAPVLDPYPNPTSYALQAFRGYASGADLLTARSGAGTATPAKVSADGKFCVEAQLLPDAPNTVVFQGVDAAGCPGRETQINITHQTKAKQDAGTATERNWATLASIAADSTPSSGVLSNINDGKVDTAATLQHVRDINPWAACGSTGFNWVRLDLGKSYTITKIKISWAQNAGSDFATCYAILLNKVAAPGDPSTTSDEWKVIKQESNNPDASPLLIKVSSETARYAALLLYFSSGSMKIHETFNLAELEVWGYDPNTNPTPPPDHCE
jgi:hypothetical protein